MPATWLRAIMLQRRSASLRFSAPETSLYAPVKRFLERLGFEVKGEICGCDLVALRGDAGATLAAAERTLTTVETGPILFRDWAEADLVPLLADVGLTDRASDILAGTLRLVDASYPAELG